MNFIGQDLAALGANWQVETEFTVKYTGGWQNTGLIVWNGDNNFFRSSITHSLNGGNIYVEQSKDNPTSTEGARVAGRRQHHDRAEPSQADHDPHAVHAHQRVQHGRRRSTGSWLRPPSRCADCVNFGGAAELPGPQPVGAARAVTRPARGSASSPSRTSRAPRARTRTPAPRARSTSNYFRVTPDPIDLRDGRADHDGDARPGGSGHRRHVRPCGQGQPLGRRHRHRRVGRRRDRVPRSPPTASPVSGPRRRTPASRARS